MFPNRVTINGCTKDTEPINAREKHIKVITDYQKDPNTLYIYTDGSKINRSGFYRIGAAAVAYHEGVEMSTSKLGLGGHAEVFDAEMAALSLAASLASDIINNHPYITHIALFTDNAAATSAIVDPKPGASQFFAIRFHSSLRPLLLTHNNLSVSISWCPSHCGITGNERADHLAKEATALQRQIPFNVTYANAKRRSKLAISKLWQAEWKNSPKEGRYAVANRIRPSLNPTHHFQNLKDKREVFGRVLQCRTGHTYTGEFRRSFLPLSPDPIACPCDNETLETRSHILAECPRYTQHRKILQKASRYIALPEILGTKKGIAALAEFIQKSGAFSRTGTALMPPKPPHIDDAANDVNDDEPRFEQDDGG
jgi:ribonuclease HI